MNLVCFSFGGTKFAIGLFRNETLFASSGDILWREHPLFSKILHEDSTAVFCDAIVSLIQGFLLVYGMKLSDIDRVGFPFPGPQHEGKWYSNNLSKSFISGVALEYEIQQGLRRHIDSADSIPDIKIVFDAQCDAAGEIGSPSGYFNNISASYGTVVNIATGVACGIIAEKKVLVSDKHFKNYMGSSFDCGTGQIGRHLLFHTDSEVWRYHFNPNGQIAYSDNAERLTDRLSGPAICARLLDFINISTDKDVFMKTIPSEWMMYLKSAENAIKNNKCKPLVDKVRALPRPVITGILKWGLQQNIHEPELLSPFINQIGSELGMCFSALKRETEWARFMNHIVLTGGIGIHFMNEGKNDSFLLSIRDTLPDCVVIRSVLSDVITRESFIFQNELSL